MGFVGGGWWGRELLPSPASNQLLPPPPPHCRPPSLLLPRSPARHQQQQDASVDCILHLWRLWALRCRCWTLSVAWTSFQNLKHTSLPPSFPFCQHPHSEFPSHEPSSLQAALCGLLEEGGGEGDRPKRCDGQPLNLVVFEMGSPKLTRFVHLDNFEDVISSGQQAKPTKHVKRPPGLLFSMSLVLCNSGSLNLAALDISQDNQSFRGLKTRLPKPH